MSIDIMLYLKVVRVRFHVDWEHIWEKGPIGN